MTRRGRCNGWQVGIGLREVENVTVAEDRLWVHGPFTRAFSLHSGALLDDVRKAPPAPVIIDLKPGSMKVTAAGRKPWAVKLDDTSMPYGSSRRELSAGEPLVLHGARSLSLYEVSPTSARRRWAIELEPSETRQFAETSECIWLSERRGAAIAFRGIRASDGVIAHEFELDVTSSNFTVSGDLILSRKVVDGRFSVVAISASKKAIIGSFPLLGRPFTVMGEPPDKQHAPHCTLADGLIRAANYVAIPRRSRTGVSWAIAPLPNHVTPTVTGERLFFTSPDKLVLACIDLSTLHDGPNTITLDVVEAAPRKTGKQRFGTVTEVGMAIGSARIGARRVESFLMSAGNGDLAIGSQIVILELGDDPSDTLKIKSWELPGASHAVTPLDPFTPELLPPLAEPVRPLNWKGRLKTLSKLAGARDPQVRKFVSHASRQLVEQLDELGLAFWDEIEPPAWAEDFDDPIAFATYDSEYVALFRRTRRGNAIVAGHYKDDPDAPVDGFLTWLLAWARQKGSQAVLDAVAAMIDPPRTGAAQKPGRRKTAARRP